MREGKSDSSSIFHHYDLVEGISWDLGETAIGYVINDQHGSPIHHHRHQFTERRS